MPGHKVSTVSRKSRKDRRKIMQQHRFLCELEESCGGGGFAHIGEGPTSCSVEVRLDCCLTGPGGSCYYDKCIDQFDGSCCAACAKLYREWKAAKIPPPCGCCGTTLTFDDLPPCAFSGERERPTSTSTTSSSNSKTSSSVKSKKPTPASASSTNKNGDNGKSGKKVTEPPGKLTYPISKAPVKIEKTTTEIHVSPELQRELDKLPLHKQEAYYKTAMMKIILRPFADWLHDFNEYFQNAAKDLTGAHIELGDFKLKILQDLRKLAIAVGYKTSGTMLKYSEDNDAKAKKTKTTGTVTSEHIGARTRASVLKSNLEAALAKYYTLFLRYCTRMQEVIESLKLFRTVWEEKLDNLKHQEEDLKVAVLKSMKAGGGGKSMPPYNTTTEEYVKKFTLFDGPNKKIVFAKQLSALKGFHDWVNQHNIEATACLTLHTTVKVMIQDPRFNELAGPAMEMKIFEMEEKIRAANKEMRRGMTKDVELSNICELLESIKFAHEGLTEAEKAVVFREVAEKKQHTYEEFNRMGDPYPSDAEEDILNSNDLMKLKDLYVTDVDEDGYIFQLVKKDQKQKSSSDTSAVVSGSGGSGSNSSSSDEAN